MSECGVATPVTSVWRNHNVKLTLIVRAADGLAQGIWNGATLAAYIFLIQGHSNKSVGIAEGIFGTFCAAAGIPMGWWADRTRRDRTLRFCGFVMLALFLPPGELAWRGHQLDHRFAMLLGAMVLWGVAEGNAPVVDAIFADSVPTGGRAGIYTLAFSTYVVASSLGQFGAAALFLASGNAWDVSKLALVILVGMGIALLPAVGLGLFDDDKTLGEESEALLGGDAVEANCDAEAGAAAEAGGVPRKPVASWTSINFLLPAILLLSDAVFGLAAGMTVKFFPIFFKEAVQLSPAATNMVIASIPLVLAPLSFLAQRIGAWIGRVPTIMLFEAIGVSSMGVVGLYPTLWPHANIIVPLIILRSAANNCCYALEKSLLMDYVRKESRGRWNSLDCVLAFGWCGSAVIGGFLLDSYGFDITFVITASVQGLAVLMLIPLLFIVPRGDGQRSRARAATLAEAPDLSERLLNGAAEGASEAAATAAGESAGQTLATAPMGTMTDIRQSFERAHILEDALIGSFEAQRYGTTPK